MEAGSISGEREGCPVCGERRRMRAVLATWTIVSGGI